VWPRCGLARCGNALLREGRRLARLGRCSSATSRTALPQLIRSLVQSSSAPYLRCCTNITPGTRKELARNLRFLTLRPSQSAPDSRVEYRRQAGEVSTRGRLVVGDIPRSILRRDLKVNNGRKSWKWLSNRTSAISS
jgi:hypothetical protein